MPESETRVLNWAVCHFTVATIEDETDGTFLRVRYRFKDAAGDTIPRVGYEIEARSMSVAMQLLGEQVELELGRHQ
jgi:hypothetical protein